MSKASMHASLVAGSHDLPKGRFGLFPAGHHGLDTKVTALIQAGMTKPPVIAGGGISPWE